MPGATHGDLRLKKKALCLPAWGVEEAVLERAESLIEGSRQWNGETRAELEKLPKDTELVFYCAGGGRSQSLAEAFRRRGFTNLHNVSGGIQAWEREIES